MACGKDTPPIELPIRNVSLLSIGQRALKRGIPISLGTPPQNLSLIPYISENHTWVADSSCCHSSDVLCKVVFGGVYDVGASSTACLTSYTEWSDPYHDPDSKEYGYSIKWYVEDSIHFAGNTTFPRFPIFDGQGGEFVEAFLGLGRYSAFLNHLVTMAAVPSSIFSLWTGTSSQETPMDGLLMIGGYDEARIGGDLYNFTSTPDCELFLNVTAMSYETNNHSTSLLDPSQGSQYACMEPESQVLQVPQDAFDKYATVTNGEYNFTEELLTYPTSHQPAGNLTITLSNGYKTVIPSSEIFQSLAYRNNEGQYVVLDDTPTVSVIDNSSFEGDLLTFGIPFMTMNYIIVDYANSMYQMAPANRSDFVDNGRAQRPKAICRQEHPILTPLTGAPTPSASLSTDNNDVATFSISMQSGNVSIIGAVAGVVLGCALLALLTMILLVRLYKKAKKAVIRRREQEVREPLIGHDIDDKENDISSQKTRKRASTL